MYDAIVIGSGAGGATLTHRLAMRGARVLLLEAGDWMRPTAPAAGQPGGIYMGDLHPDRSLPIEAVGGQTKFYGAALYRFRESDFQSVEHETGTTEAWPISYAALSPYYDHVEALYRVHGDPALDSTEPARDRPLPYDPLPHSPIVSTMVERLSHRGGVEVSPIPRALFYKSENGGCRLCGYCDAHLCRYEAKGDADMAAVRPALATGNVELLTRARVLKLLMEPGGRSVRGVLAEVDGERREIATGRVVVCCGLEASIKLLRRSASDGHPEGVGNAGGALGRYLAGHSTGMVFPFVTRGKLPEEHTKTFAINSFYHGGEDWRWPLGVIQMSGQMPMWRETGRAMRPIARFVGDHALTAFYMTEALPSRESGFRFSGDELVAKQEPAHNLRTFRHMRNTVARLFRRAGYPVIARRRAPYLWHETGGARMGADPSTSVVDPNLAVHGVDNLFVSDASVLPSAGAVNTGLTIMALATRLGDHLSGDTLSEPR